MSFLILPPSLHPSGKRYRWKIKPTIEIPFVDPCEIWAATKGTASNKTGDTQPASIPNTYTKHMACVNSEQELLISRAIKEN